MRGGQLRTNGGFLHPLLSADLRLLVALTDSDPVLLKPRSHRRLPEDGDGALGGGFVRWPAAAGSALLVDMLTLRKYAPPSPGDGDGGGGGLLSMSFTK